MSITTREQDGTREARSRHIRDDRLARAAIAAQLITAIGYRDASATDVLREFKEMLLAVEEYVDNG